MLLRLSLRMSKVSGSSMMPACTSAPAPRPPAPGARRCGLGWPRSARGARPQQPGSVALTQPSIGSRRLACCHCCARRPGLKSRAACRGRPSCPIPLPRRRQSRPVGTQPVTVRYTNILLVLLTVESGSSYTVQYQNFELTEVVRRSDSCSESDNGRCR
jgi:hypothetical protein